jgi:hypothetical protein
MLDIWEYKRYYMKLSVSLTVSLMHPNGELTDSV